MNSARGYYSLIQFCPDLSRLEAANVGVLLFCPEKGFIKARTSAGNDRVRRFFGDRTEGLDLARVNAIKAMIEEHLVVYGSKMTSLEDLQRYVATRANDIQITLPRPMRVSDPEDDLDRLFDGLVGGRTRREAAPPLPRRLATEFAAANLERFLRKDVVIEVPVFKRPITVPFAYQNGRLNLIQPVRFQGVERAETTACRYAIEGRSLFDARSDQFGQMKLLVVGEFTDGQQHEREVVQNILAENSVGLYQMDQLNALIEEIRATGKSV